MTENEIAYEVVDSAYLIHRELGPGLLESTCFAVLCHELQLRGVAFTREEAIPIVYRGMRVEYGFRADLVVGGKVIVELKFVEAIAPMHKKQLLTYLKLSNKRLGLLINLNVALIKEGIVRVANRLEE